MTEDGKDAEEVQEWAENNFEAMKNMMGKIQEEMRNNKPKQNINVRKVDSENLDGVNDDQIIVEHSVERWYSVNYFKKMLQDSSNNPQRNNGSQGVELDL